ncbi:hypothetical protein BFG57_06675 [Bacillus solimangrovi]|uniref:Yip1 domain-containing protein n=2 Tax=Bacillus solimangrovi TaxID=1305675 RepID=A0A1E5LAB7_9BACI|nr:hypothetical protein BFG57_06675 [Bacillus solimangrovi]
MVEPAMSDVGSYQEKTPIHQDQLLKVKQYKGYFVTLLKQPSQAFQLNKQDFVNGLMTMILSALTFALVLYVVVNNAYQSIVLGIRQFMLDENISNLFFNYGLDPFVWVNHINGIFLEDGLPIRSLPFFNVAFSFFFVMFIFSIVALFVMFFCLNRMKVQVSAKVLVAQYGGLIVPFLMMNVIALLLGMIGLVSGMVLLIFISSICSLFLIPGLFVYEYAKNERKRDRLYWSIGGMLAIMFVDYVLVSFFIEQFLRGLFVPNMF